MSAVLIRNNPESMSWSKSIYRYRSVSRSSPKFRTVGIPIPSVRPMSRSVSRSVSKYISGSRSFGIGYQCSTQWTRKKYLKKIEDEIMRG